MNWDEMHAHNFSFAPDAVFVTGFAYANPAPTLATLGTRARVKTSFASIGLGTNIS
jgi:hypothetical protein